MMERHETSIEMSSLLRRLAPALAAVAVLFAAAPAAAADGAEEGDEDVPEGPLGDQLEKYWSVDRDVEVIKQQLYEREGRFSAGIHVGLMSSEPFFWYVPTGLKLEYNFTNHWAVGVEGSFMDSESLFRHRTDLADFVVGESTGFDETQDALDQFEWRAHAMAVWRPLYGKLAALQRKLAHFDLNLAVGFGAVSVTRPNETRTASKEVVTPEFMYGAGIQFFATNNIVVRLSGRGYIYRGPRNFKNTENGERVVSRPPGDGNSEELNLFQELEFPSQFLIGASYLF